MVKEKSYGKNSTKLEFFLFNKRSTDTLLEETKTRQGET